MTREAPEPAALRLRLRGTVQGVGFRPFVYRIATELGLTGFVTNDTRGVLIEVEGPHSMVESFAVRLLREAPPQSDPEVVESSWGPVAGHRSFEIRASIQEGPKNAVILPDLATCPDCLREIRDPGDRRSGYPFTNCTNCGPRFTILRSLPYDRPNTTMSRFTMCEACAAEYEDPRDRRFHAQPNACPACGPSICLTRASGESLAKEGEALGAAAAAVRSGQILALKGLGGYHLVCDAGDDAAVQRLRQRKARWERPLALMVPNLDGARALCVTTPEHEVLLASAAAPIVLLARRSGAPIAPSVAPQNLELGVMLPYTPLHHLLLGELGRPVVATSGNHSDEPIAIDNAEAMRRLGTIADLFLVHDRPIERHVDDSVMMSIAGRRQFIRRARGFAPLPIRVGRELPEVLAVGPYLKNTIALSRADGVFLSQHIGDLKTPEALAAHARVVRDFLELYAARPVAVAHDLHPDYASTRWLLETHSRGAEPGACPWERWIAEAPLVGVQHHHAHLAACLADNRIEGPALGVIWDGTGLGPDGTIWGGEFLLGDAASYERVGHLRPFRLPGGDAAVKEPRRSALALWWELERETALDPAAVPGFEPTQTALLGQMLLRGVNSPVTTSAGRLFDGFAAFIGGRARVSYEGQAAIELEQSARTWASAHPGDKDGYPVELRRAEKGPIVVDWGAALSAARAELRAGVAVERLAARFHWAMADSILAVAREVGARRVALSGGCFQNRLLTEHVHDLLVRDGFEVLLHRQVPPNDGGVSLGQVLVAAASRA